jgi:hypothetical protein
MTEGRAYREWGHKGRPWFVWALLAVLLGLIAGWAIVH